MPTFRQHLGPRFITFALVIIGVLGILLVRLWTMQVLSGAAFAAQAEQNRVREFTTEASRGRILDRDGEELISNRATLAVTVVPEAQEDDEMLGRLSALLSIPTPELKERVVSIRQDALKPRTVAIDVPLETASYLAEHESEFPGVQVERQSVRQYPKGTLAAHVLGYTGEISEAELGDQDLTGYELGDIVGKAGAEAQFEKVLQGDRGYKRVEVDASGRARRVVEEADPLPGRDVVLTIDSELQGVAERALAEALADAHAEDFKKARAGAAVLLDVATGEVLAMASTPSYDPELFLGGISEEDWERLTDEQSEYPLNNRAIMAQYPPASTFKAFTGLGGLEDGLVKPDTVAVCEGRWTGMGEEWPKYCWARSGHGSETFVEGITHSCDTVFYEIGYKFDRRTDEGLQEFVRRFGYGNMTGVDLPGEVDGRVPDAAWKAEYNEDFPEYRKWLPGDTVNIAIGQGDLLATPLQVAATYGGIANGGKVMRPHVLKAVHASDGEVAHETEPEIAFDAGVSAGNLETVQYGLETVTESGTGADAFAGFEVPVAGKTGTAQVAGKDDYAWFVGYAPAEAPRYVAAVVIEQGGHGGAIAAPAVRSILGASLGVSSEHVRAHDRSR
jgi:penicillin-binding protein 2